MSKLFVSFESVLPRFEVHNMHKMLTVRDRISPVGSSVFEGGDLLAEQT